jgi:glycosyltransferase involved in cell wall biosynthesis
VQLWIIGPTLSTKEANDNEQLIAELGLNDRIIKTGFTKPQDIPQILKNATACVLARPDGLRAKAGFATKIGEYLLSENPVILTDVGDFTKFLKDGESALIVEPGDTESFAKKMNWVLENADKAREIGKNGASVARLNFNSRIEAKKMIDIMIH